jgi:SAM-dependent methyltransferase
VDCHEYHGVWAYVNFAKTVNGHDLDRDVLQTLFRDLTPESARILIAGAADHRLLRMTANANYRHRPHITVADRCSTPLSLCRRYADAHHLTVTTIEEDLGLRPLTGPYDLALAHYTLRFVPEARRQFFLRNLGRSLAPGGALVLVHGDRPAKRSGNGAALAREFSGKILSALSARGLPLPEDEARFRRRLETYAEARHPAEDRAVDMEAVEACLVSAGFRICQRIDRDRGRTISPGNGGEQLSVMFTRVFVASFEG